VLAGKVCGQRCRQRDRSGLSPSGSPARAPWSSAWNKVEHSVGELAMRADLTDESQVKAMYDRVVREHGRLDVIYNNMGLMDAADHAALDTSVETWRRVHDANLTSIFLSCKYGIPHLRDTEPAGGSVINAASFLAAAGPRPPDGLRGRQGRCRATDQGPRSSSGAQRGTGERGAVRADRDAGPAVGLRPQPGCAGQAAGALADGPVRARWRRRPGRSPSSRARNSGFITAAALPLDGGITEAFTVPE